MRFLFEEKKKLTFVIISIFHLDSLVMLDKISYKEDYLNGR